VAPGKIGRLTDAADDLRPLPPGPPSPAIRNAVIALAIGFFVLSLVGDTFLSVLYDRRPQLFIALNARNRNLALARPYLEWWEFFGIATVRLLVSDPLFFLLGRWYGDAGVRWIERRSSTYGPMARAAERWFGKAAYPLVVIAPNNYVCLFAGAGGMSVAAFAALNLVGTLGRLLLLWYLTDALADPLDWVRDLIAEHRLVVLVISAAAVGLSLWLDRRAGGGEIDGLLHLEEEIDADAERAAGTDSGDGSDDA